MSWELAQLWSKRWSSIWTTSVHRAATCTQTFLAGRGHRSGCHQGSTSPPYCEYSRISARIFLSNSCSTPMRPLLTLPLMHIPIRHPQNLSSTPRPSSTSSGHCKDGALKVKKYSRMLDEVAIQYDGTEVYLNWGSLARCYDPDYSRHELMENPCCQTFTTQDSGRNVLLKDYSDPRGRLQMRDMPLLIRDRIWESMIKSATTIDLDTSTGIPLGFIYVDADAFYTWALRHDYFAARRFSLIISTVDEVSTFNDFAKLRRLLRTTFVRRTNWSLDPEDSRRPIQVSFLISIWISSLRRASLWMTFVSTSCLWWWKPGTYLPTRV